MLVTIFHLSRCDNSETEGLESPVVVGPLGDHDRTLQKLVARSPSETATILPITLVPGSH